MDDRELLELAAKAAGMLVLQEGETWPRERVGWFFNQVGGHPPALYDRASDHVPRWAPLTDDGDALRLAVKLHINIEHLRALKTMRFTEVAASPHGRGDCLTTVPIKDDPDAATRRAIVRAAAEIGKAMP